MCGRWWVACVQITDNRTHHSQAGVVARPAREAWVARLQRQRECPEHVLLALILSVDGGGALVRDRLGAAGHLPGEPRRHDDVGPTVELGGVPAGEGVALAGDLAHLVPVVVRVVTVGKLVERAEREAAVLVAARTAAHRSVVVRLEVRVVMRGGGQRRRDEGTRGRRTSSYTHKHSPKSCSWRPVAWSSPPVPSPGG